MTIGEHFNIKGYDVVALALCDIGTVLVLNNNSTHYLLADSDGIDGGFVDSMSPKDDQFATLRGIYEYGPQHAFAYACALEDMTERAIHFTEGA